ncbi:MAG TPA: MFS transporter [Candidatus Limnocylindrales bacterium]|nr:MFS transporter [Candidatus Limnocylindrales bacterium]
MTRAERWTLLSAILGSGIVFLDGTVVNIALKRIGQELPTSFFGVLEGQAYVVSGYLAVLAALLIIAGALADFYGRRRIFVIGLTGFGASSVLCGVAPTLEFLVLARILQGVAGALLVPGALALITAAFDGPRRARAFGLWAASTSSLTLLGPVIGGLIVDSLSWRLAFLINVPLVILAVWAARTHVAETRNEDADGHFDWLGAAVGAIAVGGLAFGAIRGQERQWQDALAWTSLGVGAIALVVFPILMKVRDRPLVPLHLFAIREFAVINLATFLVYGALYVSFTYNALLYQGTLGYSALAAALVGLPSSLMLIALSARVGALTDRIGSRPFLVVGPLIMASGQLWFARLPATSAAWQADPGRPASLVPPADVLVDVLPAVLLFGLGISLVVAPLTSTLMDAVPARNSALGSAINNALSRVGQPLIGAVIFVAITASFYPSLASRVPGLDPANPAIRAAIVPLNPPRSDAPVDLAASARIASVEAFHLAALVSAGLLVAGSAVSGIGLRGRGGRSGRAQEPSEPSRPTVLPKPTEAPEPELDATA